jgi:hypothetical protein
MRKIERENCSCLFLNVDSSWFRFQPEKATIKIIPCSQGFGRHYPEAGRDADNKHHKISAKIENLVAEPKISIYDSPT